MPVFGNRMVVGNHKHVRDYQAEVDKREKILAEWEQEKNFMGFCIPKIW